METLIVLLVIAVLILMLFAFMQWFPKYSGDPGKLRIKEKSKGMLKFYRAEVYRPVLGWSPFWASDFSGIIQYDSSFTKSELFCEEQIEIYKKLKTKK